MKLRRIILALAAGATAFPPLAPAGTAQEILVASADCSRAAAEASAETGGRVLTVSSRTENGRVVCVVTVIVPADNGGRPRKRTLVMPQ